jgi:CRISPR system Cascade subunit CasB
VNKEIETQRHPFVEHLETLTKDRAALAELRRGLGRAPGEAAGMFPYVIPFVSSRYEEPDLYLIASLFALHPSSSQSGNMGDHLYAYAKAVGDDAATTRRFVQLMRQSRAALDTPLRQHISLLKSKEIAVNWHQLMLDISGWEHEDRRVQRRWARAYWKPTRSEAAQ